LQTNQNIILTVHMSILSQLGKTTRVRTNRIDGGRILVEVEIEIEVEGTLYPSGAHELTGRFR
jgi:hypothetical protein